MIIREARVQEAEAICTLLRRSITELCTLDHGGDPTILGRWIGNKTPELLREWIADPTGSFLVAEDGTSLLAIGSVHNNGKINLNYVAPEARFRGVSRAMVAALEARAKERGATLCTLSSTQTARRFYLSCGYSESAAEPGSFAPLIYPMQKMLVG